MKITKVSYGRTVNMGNYESVRFDLEARVDETEEWLDVYDELIKECLKLEKQAKKKGY